MRDLEKIKQHFEIERELAERLRNAPRQERLQLYKKVYDELFERVPDHPQLTRAKNLKLQKQEVFRKLRLVRRFLSPTAVFMEVGAGDCALSRAVAVLVKQVFAVEVSKEITYGAILPKNVELIISDGINIPVPKNSIGVAYSNQLMEHLHPEDAKEQLLNIFKTLVEGGVYICITPNRFSGPHDVSRYFSATAQGFHLKEYTFTELKKLFLSVGFRKVRSYIGGKGFYMPFPQALIIGCEKFLEVLPGRIARSIARTFIFRALLGVIIVGVK